MTTQQSGYKKGRMSALAREWQTLNEKIKKSSGEDKKKLEAEKDITLKKYTQEWMMGWREK